MERNRLQQELLNFQESAHAKEKALNDELESLKEREKSLKTTNDLLEKGLEEQKRANLDTSGKNADRTQERNLILEERALKAEAEVEKIRADRILALEELKTIKTALADAQLKLH